MVFTAGNYKTMDFVRMGAFLQVGLYSCRPQTRCSKMPD
jgi:di/tricarboxylate transporter